MKVLILIQCTNLGGMERNMLCTVDEFQKLGIAVEVVSIAPVGQLGAVLAERGVFCEGGEYKGPFGLFSLPSLHQRLAAKKADALLMIGHNFMGALAIGNLWRGKRVLSIHYHHQGVMSQGMWWLVYGIAVRKFRELIFVSRYIRDESVAMVPFLKTMPMRVSTPVVLPPLVSSEEKMAARDRLGIPQSAFVVGNAGWLIERKRWDIFLEVAAEVLKNRESSMAGDNSAALPPERSKGAEPLFLIAGDGLMREQLASQAERLGIQARIRWLGWQKDLEDFYNSIDLLLFNSDWDAQARTPLETMARGIPVVASVREGGTNEFILDKSMGVLFIDHDVQGLAGAVCDLMANREELLAMGRAARERVRVHGSPEKHARNVLEALGIEKLDFEKAE